MKNPSVVICAVDGSDRPPDDRDVVPRAPVKSVTLRIVLCARAGAKPREVRRRPRPQPSVDVRLLCSSDLTTDQRQVVGTQGDRMELPGPSFFV